MILNDKIKMFMIRKNKNWHKNLYFPSSFPERFVSIVFCRMTRHSFLLWVIITWNYHKYIYYISFCHVGPFHSCNILQIIEEFQCETSLNMAVQAIIFCPKNYELHNMMKCQSFGKSLSCFISKSLWNDCIPHVNMNIIK